MDRIEDCISFLTNKAAQQITRRARQKLAVHGVTPVQYAVLKVLWQQDGQSGADLGLRLQLDSATMTGVLDRMQVGGLIERRSDRGDRRVQRIVLTERSRSLEAPLDAVMDDLNQEAARVAGSSASLVRTALRALGDPEQW